MGFVVDVEKCTECRRCMIACSLVKSGGVRMQSSRIDIRPNWPEVPEIRVCRFEDCVGHPCIGSCPVTAIRESNGVVLIDAESCIGCGSCAAVCPYQSIRIVGGIALKCDLCGGNPACVSECVTGAIRNRGVAE
ncbi:4Fe-4S binding protein [Candidatus Bipolaricaulota bacterium]|nr:4Fe-4S binding protein [Candidatus Bipolaricaulota bacterium]